jgi:acyl dehydratase
MDHHFAATTPFRRPIAHGLLVFSVSSGLTLSAPPMRTLALLGVRDWHFRDPVFPGDTIHVVSKVLDKQVRGRGRRGQITWQRQIFNQEGKLIQEGITLTLVEGRTGKAAAADTNQESSAPSTEVGANEQQSATER